MQKIKPKKIHAIDDEIDFKAIWISINESKRLIIIVSLAFAIVSAIFLFLRPTYVSSTTIELGSYKMESTACENYSNLFKSYYHRSVRGFMSSENTQPIVWGSCNQGAVAKDGFIHNYSELIGLLKSTFPSSIDLKMDYSFSHDNNFLIAVYSGNQENAENLSLEIATFIKHRHQSEIDEIKESRKKVLWKAPLLIWLYNNFQDSTRITLFTNKIIELEADIKTLIEKRNRFNNIINSTDSPISEDEKFLLETFNLATEKLLENLEEEISYTRAREKASFDTELYLEKLITSRIFRGATSLEEYLNAQFAGYEIEDKNVINEIREDYEKLLSENLYKNSEIVGDITTTIDQEKNVFYILRSFLIGLLLSILVVLFKSRNKIL